MKKKNQEQVNLLDFIPVQNVKAIVNEQNFVVLLKPKFNLQPLKKHLLPRMKKPNYKITLDEYGTFVWNAIDGSRTVAQIGELLRKQFGDTIEPVYERLGLYIRTLEQNKFIRYSD